MRKSLEEICEITPWCYYRNVDLVGVYYGDCFSEVIIKELKRTDKMRHYKGLSPPTL